MSEEEYRIIKTALDLMLEYNIIYDDEYNMALEKTMDHYDED